MRGLAWVLHSGCSVILMVFLLASCAGRIPIDDIKGMQVAVMEAQKAGDLIYDELSAAYSSKGPQSCHVKTARAPMCFDPTFITENGSGPPESPHVTVRRIMLRLVLEYSLVLTELSEGKEADQLRKTIVEMGGLALEIATVPGSRPDKLAVAALSGPFLGAVADMAAQLRRVQSAEEVRRSLIAMETTIATMIDVLIADTADVYTLYYHATQREALESSVFSRDLLDQRHAAFHSALSSYVRFLKKTKVLHARLVRTAKSRTTRPEDLTAFVREASQMQAKADALWSATRELKSVR
ncbi:hypothetical protein [Ensifer sp. YR511]|uniref:hypothetical protein n=1 Tax=Ensifer sp. YR511 TaxID=1855294 RepID=UPI0008858B2C|nr:hypothetical protein [Ensifer sp. YR511]SDN71265.1 hypothetical protein SAMN05216328_13428 [Ensifer sp. YR511]